MLAPAQDPSTEVSERITITNDKGRLFQAEIDKMVVNAEKFKDKVEKERSRVAAKNACESYVFQAKAAVEDEKVKDKIAENGKKMALEKVVTIIRCLETNPSADKFEDQHEMEKVFMKTFMYGSDGA